MIFKVACAVSVCVAFGTHADNPSSDTVAMAAQIGLTPARLAAAGFERAEARSVLEHITDADEVRTTLIQLHTSEAEAATALTQISTQLASSDVNSAMTEQFQAANGVLEGIRQQVAAKQNELLNVALQGVSSASRLCLSACQDSSTRRVPLEFCVVNRTDEQWKLIEAALRAEARAARLGVTLDSQDAQLLSDVRSEPAVVTARSNMLLHLDEIEQEFSQYPHEQ